MYIRAVLYAKDLMMGARLRHNMIQLNTGMIVWTFTATAIRMVAL